jgi:hypothetical protein
LDGNAVPDEIGINPDGLQPGYPNSPSTSGDWGGVGAPDPTVVPLPDANRADAMTDEYGDGSGPGGNWVPEETAIDPYAPQQPAYPDPSSSSTSGDPWDPYAGNSDPYYATAPEEVLSEKPSAVPEGEDPDGLGSF